MQNLRMLSSVQNSARLLMRRLSTASSEVLVHGEGQMKIITLNRPKALNALNLNMVRDMYPLLQKWECASDVNIIIIRGTGDKAFCAGGDVVAVTKSAKDAQAGGDSRLHFDFFREEYQLNHLIGTLTKPYVALLNGIVMGGGCGVSLNGKFRVATEKTMLAMPETALGLFPDVGGSYFLSRLRNNLGMFLALTGYRLIGADTYHAGLATHYVDSNKLDDIVARLGALENATNDDVNNVLREHRPSSIPPFSLREQIPIINRVFSGKNVEEIIENLNKEDDDWSKKQLEVLSKMSPMSLKVTHQQIKQGCRLPFHKVFTMEFRLTQRFMEGHDFHEGCRAILIDKDRNPKWNPSSLSDISEEMVDAYFHPLPHYQELTLREA